MAHSPSALKRWRQSERRKARNKPVRSAARTAVRKARETITAGSQDEAQAAIREAMSVLDRAAKRRVIHPNAAARRKSRLMLQLNKVAGGTATAAPAKKSARKTTAKKAPAKKPVRKTAKS